MSRIRKMLGIALATTALSVMFVSAASAQGGAGVLTAGQTPGTHTATPVYAVRTGAVTENVFIAFGKQFHCEDPGATLTGEVSGTDVTGTLTGNYKDCYEVNSEDEPGLAITVTTNGCDLQLNQPVEVGSGDTTWEGTADIVCPEGKAIEVEAYTGAPTAHGSLVLCRQTIPPQKGLSKFTYENVSGGNEPDDIAVAVEVGHARLAQEGLCGASESEAGEYRTRLTVTSGTPGNPGTDDLWISTGT